MIMFVGSQMAPADKYPAEHADIGARFQSLRLWMLCLAFEHGVLIVRFAILGLSPEEPKWVSRVRLATPP